MKFLRTPLARRILVALLLASIPLYVLQYTLIPQSGDFGVVVKLGDNWSGPVTRIKPQSAAARAGIRIGDTVGVPADQHLFFLAPARGQHVRLEDRRKGRTRIVTLIAAPATIAFGAAQWIRAGVVFFLLIFALLTIVRAWNTEYGPLIAGVLTSCVVSPAGDALPEFLTAPAFMLLSAAGVILAEIAGGFYTLFVISLCASVTRRRLRAFRYMTYAAVLDLVFMICMGVVWGYAPALAIPPGIGSVLSVAFFAGLLIVPVALVYAMYTARADERAQVAWIFWGFFPYQCGVVLVNLNLLPNFPPTLFADPVFQGVARAFELSLPVFLFYGLLVRRTIDIGFVINRVAVYGTISVAVLAVFVALEYLVGHYVEAHSVESWALQLGIALVIGLMARYMHGAVDRFVDRVLFAKRHADESALRRFAQEAEAFSSAAALLDRALSSVNKHSETLGAAIYLCDAGAATLARGARQLFPERIAIDDPLLVALRRWNELVDTHDADAATAFPDGMVFPMSARGRLVGVLACRTKRDATAFAPDEREPLTEVARAVGRALDGFSEKPADSFDGLGQTVVSLLLSIQDAVTGLREGVR